MQIRNNSIRNGGGRGGEGAFKQVKSLGTSDQKSKPFTSAGGLDAGRAEIEYTLVVFINATLGLLLRTWEEEGLLYRFVFQAQNRRIS